MRYIHFKDQDLFEVNLEMLNEFEDKALSELGVSLNSLTRKRALKLLKHKVTLKIFNYLNLIYIENGNYHVTFCLGNMQYWPTTEHYVNGFCGCNENGSFDGLFKTLNYMYSNNYFEFSDQNYDIGSNELIKFTSPNQ